MVNVTRRTALGLLAGAAVPSAGAVAIAAAKPELLQNIMAESADPIIDATKAYWDGIADFNANAPWDDDDAANAYADVSYGPPMHALETWTLPVLTRRGAAEALRTAQEADRLGDTMVVAAMVKAALGFLESEVLS